LVETVTKNYNWTKPEIQHSPATWGSFINNGLDSIDSVVFSNQQGLVPVGGGSLWFTATPPANWLICNGQSLDTTTYAGLFAVFGYTYGGSGANFNLPNLTDRFPIGAGSNALGAAGGAATVTLDGSMIPPHAHPITDVQHNHSAYQNAHSHSVYQDAHSHGASQDAHNHTVGGTLPSPGAGAASGSGAAVGTGTTSTAQPGVHIDTQQPVVHADTQQPGVGVNASGTGLSTTQNAGGGAAHENRPPFLGINFIIRYQ
jgi:microcystin-dependent protein